MHRIHTLAIGIVAAALVAGCAGADTQTTANAEPPAPKVYRTGSNLPVKDNDGSVSSVKPDPNSQLLRTPGAPGRAQ